MYRSMLPVCLISRFAFSCQPSIRLQSAGVDFHSRIWAVLSNYNHSIKSTRETHTMASEALDQVENVEIDPSGNFKYILIRLSDSAKNSKNIVRGNIAAGFYHADILEDFENRIKSLKLNSKCLGGGRIDHQPDGKYIKVYSYSQGFGRADHRIAVDLLKSKYPDYKIEWSNDDD